MTERRGNPVRFEQTDANKVCSGLNKLISGEMWPQRLHSTRATPPCSEPSFPLPLMRQYHWKHSQPWGRGGCHPRTRQTVKSEENDAIETWTTLVDAGNGGVKSKKSYLVSVRVNTPQKRNSTLNKLIANERRLSTRGVRTPDKYIQAMCGLFKARHIHMVHFPRPFSTTKPI